MSGFQESHRRWHLTGYKNQCKENKKSKSNRRGLEQKKWYCGYANNCKASPGHMKGNERRYGIQGAIQIERKSRQDDRSVDFRFTLPKMNSENFLENSYAPRLQNNPKEFPPFSAYVCGSKLKEYNFEDEDQKAHTFRKVNRLKRSQSLELAERLERLKQQQEQASQVVIRMISRKKQVAKTASKSPLKKKIYKSKCSTFFEIIN